MKLHAKMEVICAHLDALAQNFGDYAVRCAVKRWARKVNTARYMEQVRKRKLYRSVWIKALEKK